MLPISVELDGFVASAHIVVRVNHACENWVQKNKKHITSKVHASHESHPAKRTLKNHYADY